MLTRPPRERPVHAIAHRLPGRVGFYLWQSALASVLRLVIMGSAPNWAQALFPPGRRQAARRTGTVPFRHAVQPRPCPDHLRG